MSKHVLSVLGAAMLTLAIAAIALAQTTTTTVTKTVQNPDGTYTVIEYPAKKEVQINLTPVNVTGANGVATILRDDDGTRIKLNLTSVPADMTSLNLYAVDDKGMVTALGPVTITNGVGTLATTTPLSRFMLVASPEPTLTAYDANTKVFFRSAVPEGFAVVPMSSSASGERVSSNRNSANYDSANYDGSNRGDPNYNGYKPRRHHGGYSWCASGDYLLSANAEHPELQKRRRHQN